MLLVVLESDQGNLAPASLEALTFGRSLAEASGLESHALLLGPEAGIAAAAGAHGADAVHVADHALLDDYGPELFGAAVAGAIGQLSPAIVVACGTDRGNEVMAQAAARLDLPFVANCTEVDAGAAEMTRSQWGGSLLERSTLAADTKLLTVAHHAVEAVEAPAAGTVSPIAVEVDEALARSKIVDRVVLSSGVTLSTAPVVVGGGRGVGSAEAYAPLEELADLLGGKVGCSRAVTNNGWRPHSDQVGQTGTRIAPEIYIACGISGAIQHWVGAKASKHILAINTDAEANMVTKANHAVIADLHTMVPAIVDEVKRRRA
ncbi:MAG: electron transfer flavoprotein subunit alpha/FixB family protein [Acidimicrobiales bacterium]|nr:electron transfer flavoprotein subunit alpha/FixB family protein [Acidimicrobiales bacterium]